MGTFAGMEPIKTALLSFGMSGQVFHAPFLAVNPQFDLYAVWERSRDLASAKYPDIRVFRTIESLLSDPSIELVVVNTPNNTHYEYARMALEAGKHVLVEKPFTAHSSEAEELSALARQKGLVLTVYHNRRYDSDYKSVKEVVDSGVLGELVEAEFHYDRYKEELSYKQHKETAGAGTGSLYDLGSHLIDQALSLFGKPESVFADLRILRPNSVVDDYFELLLYYPSLRVRLHCSYLVREALPAYILHGRKGSFLKAKTDVQETALQEGKVPGSTGWGEEPEALKGFLHTESEQGVRKEYLSSHRGDYNDFFNQLAKAIRKNQPPPVDPADAVLVIRLIEAAFQSDREKRVIAFKG